MSVVQAQPAGMPGIPERRLDPGLSINPPTNNPFRQGVNSPMNSPPLRDSQDRERTNQNNPFLDAGEVLSPASPPRGFARSPPKNGPLPDAMRGLSLGEQGGRRPPPPAVRRPMVVDGANMENAGPLPPGQAGARPPRMSEDQRRREPRGPLPPAASGSAARPQRERPERERRPMTAEDEKRRKERRERREREKAEGKTEQKDSQGRSVPSSKPRSSKKGPHLDVIDKLDSAGSFLDPFGGGYHVAGPYDATVPKLNRKYAPIDAFAKDSANMIMGGPLNIDRHKHAHTMHGHVGDAMHDFSNKASKDEATTTVTAYPDSQYQSGQPSAAAYNHDHDYAGTSRRRGPTDRTGPSATTTFDPSSNVEPVYGEESFGLGQTTFLDGAPAPASAIRRESEAEAAAAAQQMGAAGASAGLSRKKSLAQRFRGNSNPSGDRGDRGGTKIGGGGEPPPYGSGGGSLSAGGMAKIAEANPFFGEFDDAQAQKGARVGVSERAGNAGEASASGNGVAAAAGRKPMPNALSRSMTADSGLGAGHRRTGSDRSLGEGEPKSGGGFLGRMKSLRGRRRLAKDE